MKLAVLAFLGSVLFIFTSAGLAQAPDTFWVRVYGGYISGYPHADCGNSVQQTFDGGYIIAGYTECFGAGLADVWLIKADSVGDTLWAKTYGGQYSDQGLCVQQTSDSGYIIVGQTESFGAGGLDVYLIRTDADGDSLWATAYGGTGNEVGRSVEQTSDGGYIITGYTTSFGAGTYDVWLIKTDSNGDTAWTRTYGGTDIDGGNSVRQTSDGGYIIVGSTLSFGAGEYDVWYLRTDSTGDTLWAKTYGGTGRDQGTSVDITSDGGYIIAGFSQYGVDYSYCAVRLIKTDAAGNVDWANMLPMTYPDISQYGYSVQQTSDGGYIVVGSTKRTPNYTLNGLIQKTDDSGNSLWAMGFGNINDDDSFSSVRQTSDGGYVVVGWTESYGQLWDRDLYFVRLAYFPTIPTLSEWGMLIMGLLLLAVGTAAVVIRRRAESRVLD